MQTHQFTNNSGYGNKCKVEIISRTDLLRARGKTKWQLTYNIPKENANLSIL